MAGRRSYTLYIHTFYSGLYIYVLYLKPKLNIDLNGKIVIQNVIMFELVLKQKQTKIVSENDQEIPQSQTADNPVAP